MKNCRDKNGAILEQNDSYIYIVHPDFTKVALELQMVYILLLLVEGKSTRGGYIGTKSNICMCRIFFKVGFSVY